MSVLQDHQTERQQVDVLLEEQDVVALFLAGYRVAPLGRGGRRNSRAVYGFVAALLVMAAVWDLLSDAVSRLLIIAAAGSVLLLLMYFLVYKVLIPSNARRAYRAGENKALRAPTRVTVDEQMIRTENDYGSGSVAWRAVEAVIQTKEHIFICPTSVSAVIIPKRSFASETEAQAFLAFCHTQWSSARGQAQ